MSQWHQEFGSQIEAVFANNDDMALGAIDVLLEAGVAPEEMPVIVGVDATAPALEAMAAGTLSGTVQNAKEMPQVLMLSLIHIYSALPSDRQPGPGPPRRTGTGPDPSGPGASPWRSAPFR